MNIYVIGSGSIGKRHYDNLCALGVNATLLSMRDLGLSGALNEIANNADVIDGLVIATATEIRLPVISAAAQAHIPVYIEKPACIDLAELQEITKLTRDIQTRSLCGFMMRYNKLFRAIQCHQPQKYFSAQLAIGSDVRGWRPNWDFKDSYASKPRGGGVLLDLCHEIDMAKCLMPDLTLQSVSSLMHEDYPTVDFVSSLHLADPSGAVVNVSMDYLAKIPHRTLSLLGQNASLEADFFAGTMSYQDAGGVQNHHIEMDRNDMFRDIMIDFLRLIKGDAVSEDVSVPRLDLVLDSVTLICQAWENRQNVGLVEWGN